MSGYRIRTEDNTDAYIDDPLDQHLDQLGVYDRTFHSDDGALQVRVYRTDDGEVRIRVGRWATG